MPDPSLEIRLLGRSAVVRDGLEVPAGAFGGRLPRRLLRLLAVRRGTLVTKDALIEHLWPERAPADPSGNLEILVSRLRRALVDPDAVVTGAGGYLLASGNRIAVDIETLLESATRARDAADAESALVAARAAIACWTGEPLPEDAYEDWAAEPIAAANRAYQDALEAAAAASLSMGDPVSAASVAETAAVREPLREPAALLLVQALAASGDVAAALAAFDAFTTRLADELGLDPSPDAESLRLAVLRGEIAVVSAGTRAIRSDEVIVPTGEPAFVGRDRELDVLLGDDEVVLIAGVSGAGKSRLVAEAARRCDVPVLRARAVAAERDVPWAVARTLLTDVLALDDDAAAGLPDVVAAAMRDVAPDAVATRDPGSPSDPQSARGLAFEGCRRMLEAVAPVIVSIDDVQWADATSLQMLGVLAGKGSRVRLWLARRTDVSRDDDAIAELTRTPGAAAIALEALDASAIAELVDDPALATSIAERTDGTPLAVAEVLGELEASGAVRGDGRGRWWVRPGTDGEARIAAIEWGQRRVIQARVRRLDPAARRLLELVAVFGREIPERILAAAVQRPVGETLDRLDALTAGGFLRPGDRGWGIAHDAIGEGVVDLLEPVDAARAHALAATALTLDDAEPSEVAQHLLAAGDPSAASSRFADAAEAALQRFAAREAVELADAGLDAVPRPGDRRRLLVTRAEARAQRGELAPAFEDLQAALALTDDPTARARVLGRLAMLRGGSDDYRQAADLADLAVAEAGPDPGARAEALAVGSIVALNLGERDLSERRADEALALFERIGDARGAAGILDGRAMATFLAGRIHEAADRFDRVARLFADAGELLRVGTPRSTRGHALVFLDRPAEAIVDVEVALELDRSLGHSEGEAYALWHRAEALCALGDPGAALASAEEALAIAERIGHREWTAAAMRGIGIARQTAGDLGAAIEAFARSLAVGGDIPLFAAWARARQAMCLVAAGRPADAAPLVAAALEAGSPLASYEARLAQTELLAATRDPSAVEVARAAADEAEEGGYLAALPRLRSLAQART